MKVWILFIVAPSRIMGVSVAVLTFRTLLFPLRILAPKFAEKPARALVFFLHLMSCVACACPLDAISLLGCRCFLYPVHLQKKHNWRQQASLPHCSFYFKRISKLRKIDHSAGHPLIRVSDYIGYFSPVFRSVSVAS